MKSRIWSLEKLSNKMSLNPQALKSFWIVDTMLWFQAFKKCDEVKSSTFPYKFCCDSSDHGAQKNSSFVDKYIYGFFYKSSKSWRPDAFKKHLLVVSCTQTTVLKDPQEQKISGIRSVKKAFM